MQKNSSLSRSSQALSKLRFFPSLDEFSVFLSDDCINLSMNQLFISLLPKTAGVLKSYSML